MFRMEYILVWRVAEPTELASPADCERVIAKGATFGVVSVPNEKSCEPDSKPEPEGLRSH
jgi:hypothetical protein